MDELKKKIILNSDSIASCRSFSNDISLLEKDVNNIAVISNFTMTGFSECIKTKAFIRDIFLSVYEGSYGQWRQEIFNDDLYKNNPRAIFIFVDIFGIDSNLFFNSNKLISSIGDIDKIFDEFFSYILTLKNKTNAKIIIANAVKSLATIDGVTHNKNDFSLNSIIDYFNRRLIEVTQQDKQVFIFDFDEWLGSIGKTRYWYDKFYYLGDMRLSPNGIPMLAEEMVRYINPIFGKKKKCIVLDLDDTLWGGIVGEDGLGGIKLGPDGEGKPYYFFQKLLLSFKDKGFILAINSKNNESDVLDVFNNHPHMVLKESDFVCMKINWSDKVSNLKLIAQDLNIGLDSLVFIDDDETNILLVQSLLPEVDAILLPKDPSQFIPILLDYKGLSSLEYTDEDKTRTQMYLVDKERRRYESVAVDMDTFLKELNLVINIKEVDSTTLQRSAQLTQKTNQFNLTTKRYQEEDLTDIIKDENKIWTLFVEDRFGEYGQVGLCIVRDLQDVFEIDTLLLSCRVLGKAIEHQFLGFILNNLKSSIKNHKKIRAFYYPTKKNSQVKDFYKNFNFSKIGHDHEKDVWEIDLEDFDFKFSDFIKILN